MRRPTTLLLLAGWLASVQPAAAQTDESPSADRASSELTEAQREQYLAHYRRGVELVDADRWSDALVEFEQARRVRENPNVMSNIAIALAALGRHLEAIEALERLRAISEPADHARIEEGLERSRASLAELTLRVLPPGARISVDGGSETAASPGELTLDPGRHRIHVRASGHREQVLELELVPGQQAERSVTLERVADVLAVTTEAPEVGASQPSPPLAGWAMIGAGAAVALGSAVLLGVGLAFRAEIEGRTEAAPWDDFAERHRSAPVLEAVGGIGAGVGLAVLGVGLGLLIGDGDSSVQARVGPRGVTVLGAF